MALATGVIGLKQLAKSFLWALLRRAVLSCGLLYSGMDYIMGWIYIYSHGSGHRRVFRNVAAESPRPARPTTTQLVLLNGATSSRASLAITVVAAQARALFVFRRKPIRVGWLWLRSLPPVACSHLHCGCLLAGTCLYPLMHSQR